MVHCCLVRSCLVLSCLVLSCLVLSCLVLSCLVLSCLTPAAVTITVTALTPAVACDETAVMAGKNALSNDEDKSSTIPKQSDVILYVQLNCSIFVL